MTLKNITLSEMNQSQKDKYGEDAATGSLPDQHLNLP